MSELTHVLEPALLAVGELLAAEKTEIALVVVGGASLNLLGLINRTTQDVDVIALASAPVGIVPALLAPPDPLPEALQHAILRVSRDFGLAPDWINPAIARQWSQGIPPRLAHEHHLAEVRRSARRTGREADADRAEAVRGCRPVGAERPRAGPAGAAAFGRGTGSSGGVGGDAGRFGLVPAARRGGGGACPSASTRSLTSRA